MRKLTEGSRGIYSGTFIGSTEDPTILNRLKRTPPFPLVLLENIIHQGEEIADHNWYPLWGAFEVEQWQQNQQLQFLATPKIYSKVDSWQCGLAEICWVQSSEKDFKPHPVFSPPQTQIEAEIFLSNRAVNAHNYPGEKTIRISWKAEYPELISELVAEGWAKLDWNHTANSSALQKILNITPGDRTVSQICDIAALCNLGSVASDKNNEKYRICSIHDLSKKN